MNNNFIEIGSNFYTDKFNSSNELNFKIINNKYNLASNILYHSLGRNSISVVLNNINLKRKVALLPGYTCESVILPFNKEKYDVLFYNFNKDLTINQDDLKLKLAKYKPDVLLVHGYYGFNTFLPSKSLIESARENGCIIIEDDTQTIFSDIEVIPADYYIGSIRKWLEIPDGAYICSSKKLKDIANSVNVEFINLIIEAFKLKSNYTKNMDINIKLNYKKLFLDAQNLIDNDLTVYEMSDFSKGILDGYNFIEMKKNRINNYNFLFKNIKNKFEGIIPVFCSPLSSNMCPIYFPLYVEKRKYFQNIMSDNDIYATIIWSKSNFIKGLLDDTEYIYNNIIGIPCDQRYKIKDMERVIEVLNKYYK